MSIDSDLIAVFADIWATKAVTFGAQTTRGFFAQGSRPVTGDNNTVFTAVVTTLQIRTGSLLNLVREAQIAIEGTNYLIQHFEKMDDGAVTELTLLPVEV